MSAFLIELTNWGRTLTFLLDFTVADEARKRIRVGAFNSKKDSDA